MDEGRPVHLIQPSISERLRNLPFILGYYPFQTRAAARLGSVLARHLWRSVGRVELVHNVRSGREPLSVASLQLARSQGVPFVFTPNHHPRWVGWRYRVYLDLYRRADALIALTQHEKAALVRLGASADRVHVTGIGPVLAPEADGQRARQKYNLSGRYVLFLGQKYPYKGVQALLEAAPRVWQHHPDVIFLFVGPRTRHSGALFRHVHDPRLRELGTVDLQDKTDLLAACEVVCVPSSQESFGGVLVEGWASGKPVVAGPAPASAEVIADGVDGFFVPEQAPGAIAERLSWLLGDPDRAAAMGRRGQHKVAERFTWERLAASTQAIYASLVQKDPARQPGSELRASVEPRS
jgi:glycosyltransferase involved in cell wall biosynthesis